MMVRFIDIDGYGTPTQPEALPCQWEISTFADGRARRLLASEEEVYCF